MPNLKFYGILNFLKNVSVSSNFRKIWAIVLKMHTNTIHQSRTFVIEFDQNRLKHSIFLKIFSKLCNLCKLRVIKLKICVWMHYCWVIFHTKFGENRSRPLFFSLILILIFFYRDIKILNFDVASSVRKPKSSNILSQRKNFVKSVRKQYGNPDSHVFFKWILIVIINFSRLTSQILRRRLAREHSSLILRLRFQAKASNSERTSSFPIQSCRPPRDIITTAELICRNHFSSPLHYCHLSSDDTTKHKWDSRIYPTRIKMINAPSTSSMRFGRWKLNCDDL